MYRVNRWSAGYWKLWLLGGFAACCVLAGVLSIGSLAVLESRVVGLPGPLMFATDWRERFTAGEPLSVAWDRAMPRGYERIYLHRQGDIVGFLPESPVTVKVREALLKGQPVRATIARQNLLDRGQDLRVRLTVDLYEPAGRYPVAVQALNADYAFGADRDLATGSLL